MVRWLPLVFFGLLLGSAGISAQSVPISAVVVGFDESNGYAVSAAEQALVRSMASDVARSVRTLFPTLTQTINVSVVIVDRDLNAVGGVAGRADAPGEVLIEISSRFPGGLSAAVEAGLSASLFHEFHHLVRGWTMTQNRFGPGIAIATVNEGLASVFAETYSGTTFDRFDYPDDASDWLDEILSLPLRNLSTTMGHSTGLIREQCPVW